MGPRRKGGPGPFFAGGILILLFGLLPIIFLAATNTGTPVSLTTILIFAFLPVSPLAIFVYLGILLIVIGAVLRSRQRAKLRLQPIG